MDAEDIRLKYESCRKCGWSAERDAEENRKLDCENPSCDSTFIVVSKKALRGEGSTYPDPAGNGIVIDLLREGVVDRTNPNKKKRVWKE